MPRLTPTKACVFTLQDDDESPLILSSEVAGLQCPAHWSTICTTKDVREYNQALDEQNWTQERLRQDYRELSLEVIQLAGKMPNISREQFNRLNYIFICWCITRQRLFNKELPFCKRTHLTHFEV